MMDCLTEMDLLDFDLDIDLSAIQVSIAAEENNI